MIPPASAWDAGITGVQTMPGLIFFFKKKEKHLDFFLVSHVNTGSGKIGHITTLRASQAMDAHPTSR